MQKGTYYFFQQQLISELCTDGDPTPWQNMKKNVAFVCICWYCMSMIETETKLKQSGEDIAPWNRNPCDCRYQLPRSTCILADRLYRVLLIRLRFEEETMDEHDYPQIEDVPRKGLGWNVAVQWYFGVPLYFFWRLHFFCFLDFWLYTGNLAGNVNYILVYSSE